jgi:tetratricopeptide (TPR) repeat protein
LLAHPHTHEIHGMTRPAPRTLVCGAAARTLAFLLALLSVLEAATLLAAPAETKNLALPPDSPFDDGVEPLTPLKPRTDDDKDHIQALALFAAARVAEQKQNYVEALKNYQRAFRFDPNATASLREIVPLAFNLEREEEGVRYALLMAERDPTDANLLRRLAMYLTENGQSERALRLYEKALQLHEKAGKPSADSVLMWMEIGRLYFLAKNYERSADNFAKVIAALEKPGDYGLSDEVQKALVNKGELTYQLFGESFLEAKRPDAAEAAFAKAATFKKDEALSLYNAARLDALRKEPAQALAKLETYLTQKSTSQGTDPYELFEEVLTDLGQEDRLLERLEVFRAANPENIPLNYFIAERYRKEGQLGKARPIFEEIIAARSERPPIEAVRGLVDIYRRQQESEKLLALLGDSVGRTASLSPLGETGDELSEDHPAAQAVVDEALKLLPGDEPVTDPKPLDYGPLMAAALLALELEKYDDAEKLFEAALEAEGVKPAETLVTWGLELFAKEQHDRAIKILERGLQNDSLADDKPTLEFYLSGALEMAGRTDEALTRAEAAAKAKPDAPRFASRSAWIEFHAGRLEESKKRYQALLDQYDKNYESAEIRDVLRDSRLVLSNIAIMQDDQELGEEWLEQVLDEFPEDAGALNDLGYLWADAGKHLGLAHRMIETAVADDPKNMAYRDSLGWVLYRLGRYPEAVAELKVAASVPQADGLIFDHLAEAQLLNGQIADAIDSWRKAAAAFQRDDEPDKVATTNEKIKVAEAQATEKVAVPEPKPAPETAESKLAPKADAAAESASPQ